MFRGDGCLVDPKNKIIQDNLNLNRDEINCFGAKMDLSKGDMWRDVSHVS